MKVWISPHGHPWALLEEMVGAPLPGVARGPKGKPFFPRRPDLQFNLSHSKGWALCGVDASPIGVDVEAVHTRRASFPRQVLSPAEYAWFVRRGAVWEDLYTLWTLKEAKVKCLGVGLTLPVAEISVPLLSPGQSACLDGLVFTACGGDGWRAAVAGSSTASLEWYQSDGGASC